MLVANENIGKKSLEHYEALFEYAPMGIVMTDQHGIINAINPFALKEFGYTQKEVIGNRVEMLIPQRFQKKHRSYHKAYLDRGTSYVMGKDKGMFALSKTGEEFPVEICLSNYHLNDTNYVIAFIKNISDRKRSEAEIDQLHKELQGTVRQRTKDLMKTSADLKQAKKKLDAVSLFNQAVLKNAGAMIISTDKKGIIRSFNPEAERELGYTAAELIGKHSPILFHDKEEINKKAKLLSGILGIPIPVGIEVFLAKTKQGLHNEEEWTYIRKDGSTFPVLLNITALNNDEAVMIGYLGISINISSRKKAEKELEAAMEKEREHSELKSKFVSMASHEFRTPLSTLLSSAYLIEKYTSTDDQPKREKHLERIYSSVNMLTDILNDFLSVGKIEEGKKEAKFTHFNIQELVTSVNTEIENILKKEQKINYIHEGDPNVYLDFSMFKHLLLNLISNASKFSPEGSPIEIKTRQTKKQLMLSVKDHGMGISKEDQQHLTERFFRGANANHIQGTGLGLHIVGKYAEMMNGKVSCKSELDKGSEFKIIFNSKTV